ncbi:hypothetical protein Cfor_00619 [Coptotermes formosanus]|uniref:4Fe-4S ferredoxin-type domain-containing protein n=1 Tax=Coptotermes formosanus TaxID=36987 RepID=A0A6L2PB79_COPFO|nr:hypothetical protein Cfor_00619 [Coptotermes formosanus]
MEAFQQRAISFVPETTYLHWNTGFPAATVCEKLDNGKIWDLAKRINPSADISTISKLTGYLRQMIFYGGKCNDCNRYCSNSAMCPTNIFDLVKEVLANCTSLLGDCYWNGVKFECCDEFYSYLTPYGICYAINSLQTMKKNSTVGQRVDLISNMATGPGKLEFKVFADAEITEIENDPHISSLSLSQRGCILPHENPLTMYDIYSSSACISECQAKIQLQLCGCVHHYTPQITGWRRTCDLAGIMCIDGYAEALCEITSMGSPELNVSCDCTTPSCTEPEYAMIPVVTTELDTAAWSHFRLEMMALPTVRYRRNVIRSKLDIVVSTGGAAGFFLGASLISVVELIMYFCIRIIPRNHPPNNIRN